VDPASLSQGRTAFSRHVVDVVATLVQRCTAAGGDSLSGVWYRHTLGAVQLLSAVSGARQLGECVSTGCRGVLSLLSTSPSLVTAAHDDDDLATAMGSLGAACIACGGVRLWCDAVSALLPTDAVAALRHVGGSDASCSGDERAAAALAVFVDAGAWLTALVCGIAAGGDGNSIGDADVSQLLCGVTAVLAEVHLDVSRDATLRSSGRSSRTGAMLSALMRSGHMDARCVTRLLHALSTCVCAYGDGGDDAVTSADALGHVRLQRCVVLLREVSSAVAKGSVAAPAWSSLSSLLLPLWRWGTVSPHADTRDATAAVVQESAWQRCLSPGLWSAEGEAAVQAAARRLQQARVADTWSSQLTW
jgi:hypothetical protein